jgi:hypothetical protein
MCKKALIVLLLLSGVFTACAQLEQRDKRFYAKS